MYKPVFAIFTTFLSVIVLFCRISILNSLIRILFYFLFILKQTNSNFPFFLPSFRASKAEKSSRAPPTSTAARRLIPPLFRHRTSFFLGADRPQQRRKARAPTLQEIAPPPPGKRKQIRSAKRPLRAAFSLRITCAKHTNFPKS